jgi:hypothetical protein
MQVCSILATLSKFSRLPITKSPENWYCLIRLMSRGFLGSWVMVAAKVEEVMDITAIVISYSIPHDIHF